MLGFCCRFSLKVPGSDTSCDNGDKKGFPFRCAADRACDAGWGGGGGVGVAGGRLGARGWLETARERDVRLAGARLAGWGDGGVVQTGRAKAGWKPPASETGGGTLVTCGNRPRARLARWTLVTCGNRPRARLARRTLVTCANRPRARLARWTLVTGGNRPRARLARWTLVTCGNRPRDCWRGGRS